MNGFFAESYKKKVLKYRKEYTANNKDKIKKYREDNKEKLKEKRYADKDKIREQKKEYRKKNKEKLRKKGVDYRKKNKSKINERMRVWEKNKRDNDPLYKLKDNIRRSISFTLGKGGYKKKDRTHEILGCTLTEFMRHLNDNEYGFVYGEPNIDIDHIIPVSTATSEDELLDLNHFSNLQLLPSYYNQHIKIDKPFDRIHFERWNNGNLK